MTELKQELTDVVFKVNLIESVERLVKSLVDTAQLTTDEQIFPLLSCDSYNPDIFQNHNASLFLP